jgi:hypothetical protein
MSVITINKDMYSPRVSPHPTAAQKSSRFGSLLTRNYIPELKIVPSNLTISVQMF